MSAVSSLSPDYGQLRPELFSGILPDEYAAISAAACTRNFERGEILFLRGEAVRNVILISSGLVKIARHGGGGSEVILRLGVPGDVLGVFGLLSTGKHDETAQAFRSGKALIWNERIFRPIVDRFPILQRNLSRILGGDLLELSDRFGDLATEKVSGRVARQLMRLVNRIGRRRNGFVEIGLSREELAQMTGTTLFTVSRILSAWEGAGLVRLSRERVTICDEARLLMVNDNSELYTGGDQHA